MNRTIRRGVKDSRGNVALMFSLLFIPMILAVGAGVDFMRAFNVQAKMQTDLDTALVAAVKEVDNLNEQALKQKVKDWFSAQTSLDSSGYLLSEPNITVGTNSKSVTANVTSRVATAFMGIMNINSVPVSASSTVQGPATSYMNVYLVLDKSPSMLLAAYSADQATLRADVNISCEFACHSTADPVYKKNTSTKLANSAYDYIKTKYNYKLRNDVALTAMSEVIDMAAASNTTKQRIKVGLYTIGDTAAEVLAPTVDTDKAKSMLSSDASGLTSATSLTKSYFDVSLAKLQTLVGTAGDGTSADKPLKLVLVLTDGVQSQRNWVTDYVGWSNGAYALPGNTWFKVAPMNPAWCSAMKTNGATVGVLYTEYLPITSDWGYNATVGSTMAKADWKNTWGGVMLPTVPTSISRRNYLPYALKQCATKEDLFISAAIPADIESGLASIFEQYLSSVRLTQ